MARKPPLQLARIMRVTDLFKTGEAIVLDDSDEMNPVAVWVQKLNNFQRADALRDAQYGQSRRVGALTDDSEEIVQIRAGLATVDDNTLIEQILSPRATEFWGQGRDDVMAKESWQEKIQGLRDHQSAKADGSYVSEAEEDRANKVSSEFLEAIQKASDVRSKDAVRDLKEKTRKELEDEFVDGFRRLAGMDAWQDEYNRTEIWYALRDCVPGDLDPREFRRHAHPQLLESRKQVYDLPDELIDQVQNVLRQLAVPASEAGNSAAPRSSSASSEQPGTAEASTPSTPEETSPEPAGTSSTPSPVP